MRQLNLVYRDPNQRRREFAELLFSRVTGDRCYRVRDRALNNPLRAVLNSPSPVRHLFWLATPSGVGSPTSQEQHLVTARFDQNKTDKHENSRNDYEDTDEASVCQYPTEEFANAWNRSWKPSLKCRQRKGVSPVSR